MSIAQQVHPEQHPFLVNRAGYWTKYGRALARVRGRHDDAVVALRTAEDLFPAKVFRDPIARDVIAGLLMRSRRDSPTCRQLLGLRTRPAIWMLIAARRPFARTISIHMAVRGGRVVAAEPLSRFPSGNLHF